MTDLKPSEVLEAAAKLIEPEGAWTQGAYITSGAPRRPLSFGAGGAIDRIIDNSTSDLRRQMPLRQDATLALLITLGVMRVSKWENAPGRTQAEVVQALRDAAAFARSEGK